MNLEQEISEKSQEISTDAYAMSIGEIVSLYKSNELELHPEFQRLFRWESEQKTKFIESLLLGIPIPSIFVSQTESGLWDVVDGLQRVSTVMELMGELKDEKGELIPQFKLKGTKYLPSLENMVWSNPQSGEFELPLVAKLKIKRSRFDIKIVLNTSDPRSKYELFQRLNTGGAIATDQEVRSCILIMTDSSFYRWINDLRNYPNFIECIPLTDRQYKEQFDLELVVRFIVFLIADYSEVKFDELGSYLTDSIIDIANDKNFPRDLYEAAFKKTFDILCQMTGEDSFRKYDHTKSRFSGAVLISMFEIVALGIGYHCFNDTKTFSTEEITDRIKFVWKDPIFVNNSGSGVRASTRIPLTLEMGRELFK